MTKFEEFRGKVKTKYLAFRDKAHNVKMAVISWAKENPEEAASIACSAALVGGGAIVSSASKKKRERDEYIERETRQYDPVSGMYYRTKRPLKTKEKLELDRRMARGERKGAILDDMRLL